MTKVDVITGFLGSGKTTFLKKYVDFLLSKGESICILEFDYGAVNVDMMLLQEFNDKCDLEMVAGGCDYSCHQRRFKTKLISMGMKKYDRVIIEPSGIFDLDEFFDTIYEDPLSSWYEIGSIVSIVDPSIKNGLSSDSEYLLINQIACSGTIIISKVLKYSIDEIKDTKEYLSQLMEKHSLSFNLENVIDKDFSLFQEDDYSRIMNSRYHEVNYEKVNIMNTNSFQTLYFMDKGYSIEDLKRKVNALFLDQSFGNVLRVKGFVYDDNKWYEFNFTKNEKNLNEIENGQDVVICIGENIDEMKIKLLFEQR